MTLVVFALLLGFLAGLAAGLFGVGGGIIFVPTLLALGLSQIEAEATSLLAILPTAAAAVWRQHGYGNVRWRSALAIGIAAVLGVQVGVLVAEALSEDALRRLFALFLIAVAAQLTWRSLRG